MMPVGTNTVINLAELTLRFARVDRITYHPDGTTPESDTDHTVMLGVVACAFASRYLHDLDLGLIAQYAFVHDLVEVYAGDTPTLQIDDAGRAAKEDREAAALEQIDRDMVALPWVAATITEYERRETPEARYVKAMDKLLPKITHILNGCVTIGEQGMSREQLIARYILQGDELMAYASDFPALWALRADLLGEVMRSMAVNA